LTTHTRRTLLGGVTALGVMTAAAPAAAPVPVAPAAAAPASMPPAFRGAHAPVDLPFNPAKLNGLSERLLVSHHDNNYVGAIRNLNRLEQELAHVTRDTPAFVVGSLRQSELTFRNSMTLHEAYFGNLGGDGKAAGAIATALSAAYGGLDNWELHFRSTAAGLGGGSGWVVLGYELATGELRTTAAINHTQSLATSLPLLVMDMYEHAYALDFGAAAAKYIDAFFVNLQWDAVNRRLEQAEKLSQLLRR
jgi:superoxide dismutase, Fe-Mn family